VNLHAASTGRYCGEEATEFRLPSPALLGTLIADLLCHGNEA
jgi:hypothetical protein